MTKLNRLWSSLRTRLLLTHLLVAVVGLGVLFLTASLIGVNFFAAHLDRMRAFGLGPSLFMGMPAEMSAELNDAFRRSLIEALGIAAGAALGVAIAVSLIISRQVTQPLRRLVLATRRIAAGHYAERVPVGNTMELRQLAASFNEMAAALAGAEQRRSELIGDVAHELRTPLALLRGYLEGLQDGVVDPTERTWATLHAEAERLNRLVEDLQELSRAEAHQLPLSLRSVDPVAVVDAAVDRLRSEFLTKGLNLQLDVPRDLPMIRADLDRVVQVLTNLLSNALRYTPTPGRVVLTARRSADSVRFSVTDTGIGIAASELPYLFERFYRVDKSRARASGGSGVGLTISKALVEAMDGRIWVKSPGLGQGATFGCDLPVAR